MVSSDELLSRPFGDLAGLIGVHARDGGDRYALIEGARTITYAELDALMDRIAAGLQRDGSGRGSVVAMVAGTTIASAALLFGSVRAGCVFVPIAPSSTPEQIAAMLDDSAAAVVFADAEIADLLGPLNARVVRMEDLDGWLPPAGVRPSAVEVGPDDPINIIYSSGTTGTPKGIVHSHGNRWAQTASWTHTDFRRAVTVVATPIYSNTTLTMFIPTIAFGGTAVLIGKFDARHFLEVAERVRATHAMLVPVQYQRIMALPDFDSYDLNCFKLKACTSAPFSRDLKADVVSRWPGELLEIYGMTEGGGTCLLFATQHPDKLHTVGQPAPGCEVRLIDEAGDEVPVGQIGEVVGRSAYMMSGYHGRADATAAAIWHDEKGHAYIRHGDLGRFDEDGFLTLLGRSKDMIISGGFNIYPLDLEQVMLQHPGVADAAVIGIPSETWGETPYAYFVPRDGDLSATDLAAWVNARVGKTQRLAGAEPIAELPRSAIGKILKRELRELQRNEVAKSPATA